MRRQRTLLVFLVVIGLLGLLGVLRGQAGKSGTVISRSDPEARRLLEQALDVLHPAQLAAVETRLWQRVRLGHLDYEAEGRYLRSPDARFRLELHTRVGGKTGSLVQVYDGQQLWKVRRTDSTSWQDIRRLDVVPDAHGSIQLAAQQEASASDCGPPFSGVHPLLNTLKKQLVWVGQKKVRLAESECHLLTGLSPAALAAQTTPTGLPWPDASPGLCRLWLDGRTCWPHRVEWLTPDGVDDREPQVLAEMELRSPVFNPVLPQERCQAEFTFDPLVTR